MTSSEESTEAIVLSNGKVLIIGFGGELHNTSSEIFTKTRKSGYLTLCVFDSARRQQSIHRRRHFMTPADWYDPETGDLTLT
jgi:hypothetical protein